MHKSAQTFEAVRATIFVALLTATSFLSRTVTRPPWIGLVLLCTGSVMFEVALFSLLPLPRELRTLWPVRVLFVVIAALPALAAVVVAVLANRRSPILPDIQTPPAPRVPSVNPPLPRLNRWRDYHN